MGVGLPSDDGPEPESWETGAPPLPPEIVSMYQNPPPKPADDLSGLLSDSALTRL